MGFEPTTSRSKIEVTLSYAVVCLLLLVVPVHARWGKSGNGIFDFCSTIELRGHQAFQPDFLGGTRTHTLSLKYPLPTPPPVSSLLCRECGENSLAGFEPAIRVSEYQSTKYLPSTPRQLLYLCAGKLTTAAIYAEVPAVYASATYFLMYRGISVNGACSRSSRSLRLRYSHTSTTWYACQARIAQDFRRSGGHLFLGTRGR